MLLALILVAAVANLNLAVANVALPSIGLAFNVADQSQSHRRRLLARPRRLGALLWRARGSLRPQDDVDPGHGPGNPLQRACRLRPKRERPVHCPCWWRTVGGCVPHHARADYGIVVGGARTRSIALWSGIGAAIAALGPMLSGLALEHFRWGSVFLITLPLAVVALVMAPKLVPVHVNEGTEPVDNSGGVMSVILVGALILGINFSVVPDEGTLVAVLAVIAIAAGSLSWCGSAAHRIPSTT